MHSRKFDILVKVKVVRKSNNYSQLSIGTIWSVAFKDAYPWFIFSIFFFTKFIFQYNTEK